ncbi:hypothetical protein AB0P44_07655 [Streptomyces chartreusis]
MAQSMIRLGSGITRLGHLCLLVKAWVRVHARGQHAMTQDASGESAGRQEPHRIEVEMRFVSALPGGRAVQPAEKNGKFVWLITKGAMTEQCRREMRDYMTHIASTGMWTQNWPNPQR